MYVFYSKDKRKLRCPSTITILAHIINMLNVSRDGYSSDSPAHSERDTWCKYLVKYQKEVVIRELFRGIMFWE
jgi:hypothetical protein